MIIVDKEIYFISVNCYQYNFATIEGGGWNVMIFGAISSDKVIGFAVEITLLYVQLGHDVSIIYVIKMKCCPSIIASLELWLTCLANLKKVNDLFST